MKIMDTPIVETGRETWLEHPYTKAQRRRTEEEMQKRMKILMNTCADSSDPNVVRAFGLWRLAERVHAFVSTGVPEGGENGKTG